MSNRLKKYRNPLFFLLLVAYFSSAFQQPLQEVVHTLSHISDIVNNKYTHHSHIYYHQNNIDHEHPFLGALDSDKEQENQPVPTKQDTKKKVELSVQAYKTSVLNTEFKANNFQFLMGISLFQKETLSPPPRFL